MERDVVANGVRLRITEEGQGPLVILCHGWPELRQSWSRQLPAVAAAGFRAVAPDLRGFGDSEAPGDIGAYSIFHLVGDLVALVHALGEERAILVGHDFGAHLVWNAALLRPDAFPAMAAMSVPYRPRSSLPTLEALRRAGFGEYYWHYLQAPGVAEAELERDVDATFRRFFHTGSGDAPDTGDAMLRVAPGSGMLDGTMDPGRPPGWLTATDFAVYVDAFRRTGFRGGLNWYRNIDRNWELTAAWHRARVRQPALFIAGTRDVVIRAPIGARALAQLRESVPGLTACVMIEGGGHWIQQERASEVNSALVSFLQEVRCTIC